MGLVFIACLPLLKEKKEKKKERKKEKKKRKRMQTLPAWIRAVDLCSALPNGCSDSHTTSHLEKINKRGFLVDQVVGRHKSAHHQGYCLDICKDYVPCFALSYDFCYGSGCM